MTDVLTNHSWDDTYKTTDKKKKDQKNNGPKQPETKTTKEESGTSLTQKEKPTAAFRPSETPIERITCYCCGDKGHYSPDCPKLNDIERKDWKHPDGKKKEHLEVS